MCIKHKLLFGHWHFSSWTGKSPWKYSLFYVGEEHIWKWIKSIGYYQQNIRVRGVKIRWEQPQPIPQYYKAFGEKT